MPTESLVVNVEGVEVLSNEEAPKKMRGRPKGTTAIAMAERRRDSVKVGRKRNKDLSPQRILEFKERLMGTTGNKVIEKLIGIALNDEHDGQMAALKMCVDRILPMSAFNDVKDSKPMVQVTIVNATEENNNRNVVIEMEEQEPDDE